MGIRIYIKIAPTCFGMIATIIRERNVSLLKLQCQNNWLKYTTRLTTTMYFNQLF